MSEKRNRTCRVCSLLGFTALVCLLMSTGASAQSPAKLFGQQFQFGFRGGVSWAELVREGEPIWDGDSRRAITAGAFWAFPVSSRFAIQPEITLKRYGTSSYMVFTSVDYPDGYAEGIYSRNLDYIAISSMVRFQPVSHGVVLPFLLAGPRIDINYRAEEGLEDDYYDIPDAKRFTFGLDFGGMLVLNLETPVFIDIRGSFGLTNVFELLGFSVESWEPVSMGIKGNMLSITAGVILM